MHSQKKPRIVHVWLFISKLGVFLCLLSICRWIWRMVDDYPVIQADRPGMIDLAVTVNVTFQRLDLYCSGPSYRERTRSVKVTEVFT
jgi:hypothetical protein